nr:helix-turn-helix domain-containing protein [Candidatus Njordarchaeum guaymaensis]
MSSVEKLTSSPEATYILKVLVAFGNASVKRISELTGYGSAKVKEHLNQLVKADVVKKNREGSDYTLTNTSLAEKIKLSLEDLLIREAGEELTMVLFNVNMAKSDLELLNAIKRLNNFLEGIHGPIVRLDFSDIVFDLADKLEKQIMG